MLKIYWGDSLTVLAETLYNNERKADIYQHEAVLVGSPLSADWLRQFQLFDYGDKTKRIFANWEFPSFYIFINDWLEKALHGTAIGLRKAGEHPYSRELLQWRLWQILGRKENQGKFAVLDAYHQGSELRLLELCTSLAQLYDQYQILRPQLMQAWKQHANFEGLDPDLHWQAELWRSLIDEIPESYTDSLLHLADNPQLWKTSGIIEKYARISLFNLNHIAPLYMKLFQGLAQHMPVELYVFAPCHEYWLDDSKKLARQQDLETPNTESTDRISASGPGLSHPLLGSLGSALQPLLRQMLDLNLKEKLMPGKAPETGPQTLLQALQENLRRRDCHFDYQRKEDDRSMQIHCCHTMQRQCEVAKDLAWRWLDEHPEGQPRDIQILVAEYDKYAPLLQAVFNPTDKARWLPAVLQKTPAASAGTIAGAFLKIIALPQSRLGAAELMSILSVEPIAANYGFAQPELEKLRRLIEEAKIRWGEDREHLLKVLAIPDDKLQEPGQFPAHMTWQRGMDRLLLGYCMGRMDEEEPMLAAAELGQILINDKIEGENLELLESFCRFYDDLLLSRQECSNATELSRYVQIYRQILQRFFRSTEYSYQELRLLHRAIEDIERNAAAMNRIFPGEDNRIKLGSAAMAKYFERKCQYLSHPQPCHNNTLVIAPLQSMHANARKLTILIGLSEGSFPRMDNRSAFDLLERSPEFEDPSLRRQDRLAMLEAIMASSSQLHITYIGKSDINAEEFPPSSVISELRDFLGAENLPIIEHRLNAHDHRYYKGKEQELFSYSQSNYRAALSLYHEHCRMNKKNEIVVAPTPDTETVPQQLLQHIKLSQLQEFFSNPAQFFLRRQLGLFFERGLTQEMEEDENFEQDNLERYTLRSYLVKMICHEKMTCDQNDLHYLRERALIPLGKQGEMLLEKELSVITDVLCETRRKNLRGLTYVEALRKQPETKEYACEVEVWGQQFNISGKLQINTEQPAQAWQIFFRPGSDLKGKDWASGWLAHLLANCCHSYNTATFLGSLKAPQALPDFANTATAPDIMQDLVQLYLEYQNKPFVFSSEAAAAYFKEYRKCKDSYKKTERALIKAVEALRPSSFPGAQLPPDPYTQKLWGKEDISEHPDFEDNIRSFWGL